MHLIGFQVESIQGKVEDLACCIERPRPQHEYDNWEANEGCIKLSDSSFSWSSYSSPESSIFSPGSGLSNISDSWITEKILSVDSVTTGDLAPGPLSPTSVLSVLQVDWEVLSTFEGLERDGEFLLTLLSWPSDEERDRDHFRLAVVDLNSSVKIWRIKFRMSGCTSWTTLSRVLDWEAMAETTKNPEKPLAVFVETNDGGLLSFWNLSLLFGSRDGWLEPVDTEGEHVICLRPCERERLLLWWDCRLVILEHERWPRMERQLWLCPERRLWPCLGREPWLLKEPELDLEKLREQDLERRFLVVLIEW